ncbi:MAG: ECF-type sigma factor [Thermoanaerobaculia bacterium]
MPETTLLELLAASRQGESGAFQQALAEVYDELRRLAHFQRRALASGATLSTTALVHETFLKLSQGQTLAVQDRHHLMALAARAMRMVLVDAARARGAEKRGADLAVEGLDPDLIATATVADEMLALDRALRRLEERDEQLARLVEWRYFGGMNDRELAEAFGRNERTIRRDWQKARAFLVRELGAGSPAPG